MPKFDHLPKFKYQPNLYIDPFTLVEFDEGTCECCGKQVDAFIDQIYAVEEAKCICLQCVADGTAAKKFDGDFIQDVEQFVDDAQKNEELFKRTPGYESWQGENWLVHCEDYCAYLGRVGYNDLKKMDLLDKVDVVEGDIDLTELEAGGSFTGYLFQCLNCGQYRLYTDCD